MLAIYLRDRLPSALVTIALQIGLVALLAFSFEAVRHTSGEKETTITLSPLVRPVQQPTVIDARGTSERRKTSPSQVSPEVTAPIIANPSTVVAPPVVGADGKEHGVLEGLSQAPIDCLSQSQSGLTEAQRAHCPSPPKANANEIPLHPDSHVKDEPYWEGERENSKAPVALPGAAAGPFGILLEALLNPGAFANKEAYSYGPLPPPKAGTPADPNGPPPHASDDAFKAALKAVHARDQALYGKPAPVTSASPAQTSPAANPP
jgi:hypothetical protein